MPKILTVAETGSTNDDLKELAREGVAEGTWLRAERQTTGRGRQGRSWESPAGNLYASALVRLRPDDPPAASLALLTGVALWDTVHEQLPARNDLKLKWPNDLLIGKAKLAGILLERESDIVIIGCGANLAHHPEGLDKPATDLASHGSPIAPAAFLEEFAERFASRLERWREAGLPPLLEDWHDRALAVGTAIAIHDGSGEQSSGRFDGLTEEGALRLRLENGQTRVIHAGDVFLV